MFDPDEYELTNAQVAAGRAALIDFCESTDDPLVTVIIPTYNNEDQIEAAVNSALNQTLAHVEVIVVDDCSTDGTAQVLQRIASSDPRLIVSSTPTNSGGAGAPRNIGLAEARGPFIMFLDGDDELERHAAKNLAVASLGTDSDITMAKTQRIDVKTRAVSGWHSRLFNSEYVIDSIEINPDLLIDSNSVAKLYRRDFLRDYGLRFPAGVHYEDLIFTADVFSSARRITVIPELVYRWNIYPQTIRTTITQQRDSIKSLEQRIGAIEIIIEMLSVRDVPQMLRRIYLKLLRHDFKIYLNDIADGRALEFADRTLAAMQALLETVPEDVWDELTEGERFLYAAVAAGRPNLVPQAVLMTWRQGELLGNVTDEGGVGYWENDEIEASGSPLAKRLATFDIDRFKRVPWIADHWYVGLLSISAKSDFELKFEAQIADPLNKLSKLPGLRVVVRFNERTGQKRRWHTDAVVSEVSDGNLRFSGTIRLIDPVDSIHAPRITVRVTISSQSAAVEVPLRLRPGQPLTKKSIRGSSPLSKAISQYYRVYSTNKRTLALRPARVTAKRKPVARVLNALTAPVLKSSGVVEKPRNMVEDPLDSSVYAALRKLPLNSKKVLVESHMGRTDKESPAAIADAMKRLDPSLEIVFSATEAAWWRTRHSRTVTRGSYEYLRELATAKYLVDNQTLPKYFVKRPGQVYIQTWHGIPLKKMGLDTDEMQMLSKAEMQDALDRMDNWDYISVPSEYFKKTFLPAYRISATQLPLGTPRNDELVNADESTKAQARASLGIPDGKRVVLYAPTFRPKNGAAGAAPLEIDFDEWSELLPEDTIMLIRAHYLTTVGVPGELKSRFVNVSGIVDSNLPMLASDLLVTDFSSIMFDYLSLDRPIIIYAEDLDEYANESRGTYFDIRETPPGPIAESVSDLMTLISTEITSDDSQQTRGAFRDAYAGVEPGNAAELTAQTVLKEEQ